MAAVTSFGVNTTCRIDTADGLEWLSDFID